MGWLIIPGSTKKSLIGNLTEDKVWEVNGRRFVNQTLRHCYRGNNFSGILWSVVHQWVADENGKVLDQSRWIRCDMLQYRKDQEGWGYKDMTESCGLFYYSCPLSYLEMVPVVTNQEWRNEVRAHHERALQKRRRRREALLEAQRNLS